jgi:hypothetical protein
MFAKWEYERLLGLCYSLQYFTFGGHRDQLPGLDHSGLYDWLTDNFSWDESTKNWTHRKG